MRRLIVASVLSGAVALAAGTATTPAVAATTQADMPNVGAAEDNLVKVTRDGASLQYLRRPMAAKAVTGKGATRSDFDGDGIDDLAAGTANGVMVSYSSAPYRDFLCSLSYPTVCDSFGAALASGDFNADGFDDLVIGSPDEDPMSSDGPAGGVWMFPGGPEGLSRAGVRHWTERSSGVPGTAAPYDRFGEALAVGDITGDGRDDLAIGVPGKLVSKRRAAGAVVVLQGSVGGISTTGAQWITQSLGKVPGTAETGDLFGAALAIGKVNKDRFADLVIGSPGEDDGAQGGHGSGSVTLAWGAPAGVTLGKSTTVTGNGATGKAWAKSGNYFWYVGATVAVTDTTGDGFGEVITGSSGAQINNDVSGAVLSFAGRAAGLSTKGMKTLSLDTAGVTGTADDGDGFGASLAVGDVTGDKIGDLLVGAPGEKVGKIPGAGAVVLLRGSKTGLTGVRSGYLRQGGPKVPGSPERGDGFGSAIALLNLNGAGGWDAVVGTVGERNSGDPKGQSSGGVTRFVGGSGGLTATTFTAGNALGMNVLPEPLPTPVQAYGGSFAGPQAGG